MSEPSENKTPSHVTDYGSLPFFNPWRYQALTSCILGSQRRISVRGFIPVSHPCDTPTNLAAVVVSAMRGTPVDEPPPTVLASYIGTIVIDVDAPHHLCNHPDRNSRLCHTCAARVERAVAAVHTCVETTLKIGRMLWFNSSSRGAHGYIINPDMKRIPVAMRQSFVHRLAMLTGTVDEVDCKPASKGHWIRAPGTLGSKGVLAPITDPMHYNPLTTPRVKHDDIPTIEAGIAYAIQVISEARKMYPVRPNTVS